MKSLLVVLATVVSFTAPASAMTCAQKQEAVRNAGIDGVLIPNKFGSNRVFRNSSEAEAACKKRFTECTTSAHFSDGCNVGGSVYRGSHR